MFFHYLLAHGSGQNVTEEARTTLFVQLRDPANQPLTQDHASRRQGMMLAGTNPGGESFAFAWEADAV